MRVSEEKSQNWRCSVRPWDSFTDLSNARHDIYVYIQWDIYIYIYIFLLYMLYIIHKEMIFLQSCIFLLNIFFCVKFYQKHLDSWDPLFFPGCSMSLCLNWGPGGSDVIVAILFASKTDAVGWNLGTQSFEKTPETCHSNCYHCYQGPPNRVTESQLQTPLPQAFPNTGLALLNKCLSCDL